MDMLFVHKMESVFSLCHLITCGESYGCVSGQLVQWVSVWSTLINRSPFLLDLYISRLLRHKGLCCLHYLLNAKACCSGSSFPSLSLILSIPLSFSLCLSFISDALYKNKWVHTGYKHFVCTYKTSPPVMVSIDQPEHTGLQVALHRNPAYKSTVFTHTCVWLQAQPPFSPSDMFFFCLFKTMVLQLQVFCIT